VSIIEQAAKRLEQLRNAGVDSSQLPDTDRIPAAEDRRSVDDHPHVPEAIIQALESELVSKPAQTRPVRASPNRASPNDSAIARGLAVDRAPARRVDIDLDRLRQTGYVTPDAPRTQIADEFRVIKRPLLDNAQ